MFNYLHGVEIELQLMVEIDGKLTVVDAANYLGWKSGLLPACTEFDLGNIEISTIPCETYFKAIEHANYILINKLIPALTDKFRLKKFALFLPVPMSTLFYDDITVADVTNITIVHSNNPTCLKHWNISFENKNVSIIKNALIFSPDFVAYNKIYTTMKDKLTNELRLNWKYNYDLLEYKGYSVSIKDIDSHNNSRVHIKIPYHYVPPEGNPDLMPNFEDTLIPPDRWKSLVGYCRDGKFNLIRKLI